MTCNSFVMGNLEDGQGEIEHSELFAGSLFFMSAGMGVPNPRLKVIGKDQLTGCRGRHCVYGHSRLDGHVITPGTQVGVSTYAIHHNEEYFSDPFSFRPERWLADTSDASPPSCTPAAFVPFSTGARSCAVNSLAYLECSLVAAKALWYFDFEKAPGRLGGIGAGDGSSQGGRGRKQEFQLFDVITSRHDGPYLVFKPRGDYYKEIGVCS